jgi:hypothetical protein
MCQSKVFPEFHFQLYQILFLNQDIFMNTIIIIESFLECTIYNVQCTVKGSVQFTDYSLQLKEKAKAR